MKKEGQREEWYVRDASGNIMSIYHRDISANSLAQIELPIYGSGKIGNAFRQPDHLNYNYELTDHLGNVRATFSGMQLMAVATMEPEDHEWEAQYFDNLEATRNNTDAMSHNSSGSSALLSGPMIGPALTAQVKGGSELTLKVWGRYIEPEGTLNNAAMGGALGGLLSGSLDGAAGGEGNPLAPDNVIDLALAFMSGVSMDDPTVPKAYLQYILFDENWGYVTSDEIQVPSAAEGSCAEIKLEDIPVGSDGYLYVYVVNESEIDVHFDNLTVGVLGLNVLSTRNYYPYGSVAQECLPAGQAGKNPDFDDRYRFGYQGQFAEEDTVTGWNHFELRELDTKIGRWTVVDPAKYVGSPYRSMSNNPIFYSDVRGDTVDLGPLLNFESAMGSIGDISANIIGDIEMFTGLVFDIDNGILNYHKDEAGNPILTHIDGTSPTAREMIIAAIQCEEIVKVDMNTSVISSHYQKGSGVIRMGYDSEDYMSGVSNGLNPKTMGYGMVFLHELGHTTVGYDLRDRPGNPGPNVNAMNQIRRELGSDYGQRLNYAPTKSGLLLFELNGNWVHIKVR